MRRISRSVYWPGPSDVAAGKRIAALDEERHADEKVVVHLPDLHRTLVHAVSKHDVKLLLELHVFDVRRVVRDEQLVAAALAPVVEVYASLQP